jgi:hypothetical protein
VAWLTNLVHGWTEELKILLNRMGLSNVKDLVGNREFLLYDTSMNLETMDILGLRGPSTIGSDVAFSGVSGNLWTPARINMLREMAGTVGKAPGEAEISSMGAVSAPFVETPSRVSDWLVSDGAQVTRPSIDPYREEIEIFSYIPRTGLRLAAPFFFTHLQESTSVRAKRVFARTAVSMGLLFDAGNQIDDSLSKYLDRLISNSDQTGVRAISVHQLSDFGDLSSKTLVIRIPSSRKALEWAKASIKQVSDSVAGIIVDEDLSDSDLPLEISTSQLDRILKSAGRRSGLAILAESNSVRGADDVFKLVALGADAVGLGLAALTAIGFEESDREVVFDASKSTVHLENFVLGIEKEIKLLAGAAGVSSLSSSLVGNRELLRSVNLSPDARRELAVKPAGGA